MKTLLNSARVQIRANIRTIKTDFVIDSGLRQVGLTAKSNSWLILSVWEVFLASEPNNETHVKYMLKEHKMQS